MSAIVLTFNEELNLPNCLASLDGWCQDIHIVDSGSTDRTLEIAAQFGARVWTHEFTDHQAQWNWALAEVAVAGQWVLALDADHAVSDELRAEIDLALARVSPDVAGFYIPHRQVFRGRAIRGVKSQWLQLVRPARAHVDRTEIVDSRFAVDGRTRKLKHSIVEHNLRELSIEFWAEKHLRYANRVAVEEVLRKAGRLGWDIRPRLLGNPDERVLWLKQRWYRLPLHFRPLANFVYRYVLRLGFLDGRTGLTFHLLHSLWFRLVVDLRISELEEEIERGAVTLEALLAQVAARR